MAKITDPTELERLRELHNPDQQPTGPYTGRCTACHGRDLWTADNQLDYGCNCCGAFYGVGDMPPLVVRSDTGEVLGPAW